MENWNAGIQIHNQTTMEMSKWDLSKIVSPIKIDLPSHSDQRGVFRKFYSSEYFQKLDFPLHQINIVTTSNAWTFRGFHWQIAPHQEYKFLQCTSGKILDVAFDTKASRILLVKNELTKDSSELLVIPPYWAHGYLTLENEAQVVYASTGRYSPTHEKGARWDDINLNWDLPNPLYVSDKDQSWEDIQVL